MAVQKKKVRQYLMLTRYTSVTILILTVLFLAGCAGGGSPVEPPAGEIPGLTEYREVSYIGHERPLLGFWACEYDTETGDFNIIPMRQTDFHLNTVKWFNSPGSIEISIVDANLSVGEITIDVTFNHPFPDSIFRGFDVRGIVFGDGVETLGSKDDPDIMWLGPGGFRLRNADGWTRWWNPTEFTTPSLFGYSPGALGGDFTCSATLNPYKYFANSLTANEPVVPSVNSSNRGTFATDGGPVTRRYELKFPLVGGFPSVKFQYAIDANWAPPTGGGSIPSIDYFPPGANSPEAFHIEVDASKSTAYYFSETNFGGDLILDIEVYDWGAPGNPAGVDGEISAIKVESDTLFDQVVNVPIDSDPGTSSLSGVFHITIPDVHPSGNSEQEILVTVVSSFPDSYQPPAPGFVYPEDAYLSAYSLVNVPIKEIDPGKEGEINTNGQAIDVETQEYFSYILDTTDGLVIMLVIEPNQTILLKTVTLPVDATALDVEDGYAYVIDTSGNFLVIDVDPVGEAGIVHTLPMAETLTSVDVDGPYAYVGGSSGNLTILNITTPEFPSVINSVPVSGSGGINDITADDGYAYVAADNLDIFDVVPPAMASIIKTVSTTTTARAVDVSGSGYAFVGNSSDEFLAIDVYPPVSASVVDTLSLTSTVNDIDYSDDLISLTVTGGSLQVVFFNSNSGNSHMIGEEDELTDPNELSVDHNLAYVVDEGQVLIIELWGEPFIGPSMEVIDPNGGEQWAVGSDHEIFWIAEDLPGTIFIEYSKDNFVSDFHLIAAEEENDGFYIWTDIPDDPSDSVRVRVTYTDDPGIYDVSDADFTIVEPWFELTVPNGGEEWLVGGDYGITWNSGNVSGSVVLEYSKDNFVSDINIIDSGEANDGSYTWTDIPDDPSDTVRVRLSSTSDPGIYNISDEDFSIVAPEDTGWAVTWGEYDENDEGRGVTTDESGNIYVTGSLNEQAFLMKYSASGVVAWGVSWGGDVVGKHDVGNAVEVDGSGNVWVVGEFWGFNVDFDPGPGTDEHDSNGSWDCFLTKFDADGNFLWAGTWGDWDGDYASGIGIADSGDVYVTGSFRGAVDFDPSGPGSAWGTSVSTNIVYLSKFDTDCSHQWVDVFCEDVNSQGYDVALGSLEYVYVTGKFMGNADFDPGLGEEFLDSGDGQNAFLCKFNSSGIYQWARNWGSQNPGHYTAGYGITIDGLSKIYVCGYFTGTNVDFDPDDFQTDYHDSIGGYDAFLSKFDSTGDFLWTGTWGGTDNDFAYGVSSDTSSNIYVTGAFEYLADFDPDEIDEEIRSGYGTYDAFLSKFDSSCDFQWVRTWGSNWINGDSGLGVGTFESDCVYVTGYFCHMVDFAPHDWPCDEDPDEQTGDDMDIFLTKHLADGCW